eukprot:MONOS_14417.1-p1 / transcript=MONOS_14417.1 / gene=MONOS_14417 / organism=Monocercomonoides_exilis_PA203 / gene_product=transporter, major facilitator subfamily protein , unspecified product / transcript_product=transporter, major facilitator subfamily protein / location=Mono_scaffold00998:1813-3936(+) / protein_length=643 / sequence_SO=supercontig / SO=protein_coding / is_pseudo=false
MKLHVYKRRWYVLFVYCANCFLLSAEFIAFNATPQSAQEYYKEGGITMSDLNLVLSLSTIIATSLLFIPIVLDMKFHNFRVLMLFGSWPLFLCCLLRMVPTWIGSTRKKSFWFILLSSVLNQIGGCFLYSTPSRASNTWFPPKERGISTGLASQSIFVGVAVGFLVAPLIVKSGENIPTLLYLLLGVQAVITGLATIYFPSAPPTPPSYSELAREKGIDKFENKNERGEISHSSKVPSEISKSSKKSDFSSERKNHMEREYDKANDCKDEDGFKDKDATEMVEDFNEAEDDAVNEDNYCTIQSGISMSNVPLLNNSRWKSDEESSAASSANEMTFSAFMDSSSPSLLPSPSLSISPTSISEDPSSPSSSSPSSTELITSNLHSSKSAISQFCSVVKGTLCNLPFMLLCIAGGLQSAAYQGWQENITYFFTELGMNEQIGGLFGFASTIGSCLSAMFMLWLSSGKLRKKDKWVVFALFLVSDVILCVLFLVFPMNFGRNSTEKKNKLSLLAAHLQMRKDSVSGDIVLFECPKWLFCTLVILVCVIGGAPYGLFFEMGAELTYPLPESVSGSIIMIALNVFFTIVLLLFSFVKKAGLMTLVSLIGSAISTIGMACIKMTYKRGKIEETGSEQKCENKSEENNKRK